MHNVAAQFPKKLPCRIAIVGEAPGDEEIATGEPFVGPSGQLLNTALRMAGIDRSQCLVTNVFNEQLPDNDLDNWCAPTKERDKWPAYTIPPVKRGRYLRPEHVKHLKRLKTELQQASANVIIPLGATALWALDGVGGITTLAGAVAEARMLVPGVKLCPTLHPAHLLRGAYKMLPILVMNLMKAREESAYPEVIYTKRELWLEPSIADIKRFIEEVKDAEILSIDIETIPCFKQITCIGFADTKHRALVIPFVDKRNLSNSYWDTLGEEVEAVQLVKQLCEMPMSKIGQNFTYDLHWLWFKWGIGVRNYCHDTRLQSHALYPELPKDLGTLGACYANERAWKQWGGKGGKRDD